MSQYLLNLMKQIGENLYSNFHHKQNNADNNVSVLVIGRSGVGKSRLVNNLCESSQKVGIGRNNVTKQLYFGNCKYLEQETLLICDTPGINQKQPSSSLISRRALRYFDWNLVIIIAKLTARFQDETISQLFQLSKLFKDQPKRVIFLVSHGDMMPKNQQQNILAKFHESLEQKSIKQKVILFSNQYSNFQQLSKIIYQISSQNQPKNFIFEDKVFCRSMGYSYVTDSQKNILDSIVNQIQKQKKEGLQTLRSKINGVFKQRIKNQSDQSAKQIKQLLNEIINQYSLLYSKADINTTASSINKTQLTLQKSQKTKQNIKLKPQNIVNDHKCIKTSYIQRNNSQKCQLGSNECKKIDPKQKNGECKMVYVNGIYKFQYF